MISPGRQFNDLLHSNSSHWAKWDASQEVKVGDYGKINRDTGRFENEGNVYEHASTKALAASYPPITSDIEDTYIITSYGAERQDLAPDVEEANPEVATASIKGEWDFKRKRGALAVVSQPRRTSIPPDVFLKHLVDVAILQTKVLVTEVVSCSAYAFYLASSSTGTFSIALTESASDSESKQLSWWTQSSLQGSYQSATDSSGKANHAPLFTMKQIFRRGPIRRDSPPPERKNDDLWIYAHEPWDPLSDDGEEELFEDTVFG